jgi:hypothetical protein
MEGIRLAGDRCCLTLVDQIPELLKNTIYIVQLR